MVFIILGLPSRIYNKFTVLLLICLSLYFLLVPTQSSHWFRSRAAYREQLSIKNGLKRSLYKLFICLNLRHVSNTVTNSFIKKLYSAACLSFSFFLSFFFFFIHCCASNCSSIAPSVWVGAMYFWLFVCQETSRPVTISFPSFIPSNSHTVARAQYLTVTLKEDRLVPNHPC